MLTGRQNEIFNLLQENGKVSVSQLAKTLFVSEMTIRRDLKSMERSGFLIRCRGGAVYSEDGSVLPISRRFHIEEQEKRELALRASKHLSDGICVYLDSSSTCSYLVWHIKNFHNITIVTNSVKTLQMASRLDLPTFLIGGSYNIHDMCCIGSLADETASKFNVDVAFFSVMGISEDGIISDSDLPQTSIRKMIMKNSKKNIFLFEKNKLNKKFLFTLCRKDNADEIIIADNEKSDE